MGKDMLPVNFYDLQKVCVLQILLEWDGNVATLWNVTGIKEVNACKVFRTVCYVDNSMLHNMLQAFTE